MNSSNNQNSSEYDNKFFQENNKIKIEELLKRIQQLEAALKEKDEEREAEFKEREAKIKEEAEMRIKEEAEKRIKAEEDLRVIEILLVKISQTTKQSGGGNKYRAHLEYRVFPPTKGAKFPSGGKCFLNSKKIRNIPKSGKLKTILFTIEELDETEKSFD